MSVLGHLQGPQNTIGVVSCAFKVLLNWVYPTYPVLSKVVAPFQPHLICSSQFQTDP